MLISSHNLIKKTCYVYNRHEKDTEKYEKF